MLAHVFPVGFAGVGHRGTGGPGVLATLLGATVRAGRDLESMGNEGVKMNEFLRHGLVSVHLYIQYKYIPVVIICHSVLQDDDQNRANFKGLLLP